MQETRVQSLSGEDPLEKEVAVYSSILAWEISWTEEPGGLQSLGSQKSQSSLVFVENRVLFHLGTQGKVSCPRG